MLTNRNEGLYQDLVVGVLVDAPNKTAINLENVEVEIAQVTE